MPYLGVDVSKDTLTLAKRQDDGSFLTLELPNREEGFRELLARFPDYHVVMEVSGPYGFPLAYFLHDHGMTVSMVNLCITFIVLSCEGPRPTASMRV